MALNVESALFCLFGLTTLVSALGVVLIRNAVKGALSLILCFFGLAALFLLQAAELLAVLEVLVYAGAIMVLFVFVIMLVENKDEEASRTLLGSRLSLPLKVGAVAVVGYAMTRAVSRTAFPPSQVLTDDFGTVQRTGLVFLRDYLFHFELTSLLLLVAIVGAVVISRRASRDKGAEGEVQS
ncbi:MAG: NADH-quinone oxidoreductase subunit J [Myxococcota bacterium]